MKSIASDRITHFALSELKPFDANYRKGDIGAIVRSICVYCFNGALRVWRNGIVAAGNHSLFALQAIKAKGFLLTLEDLVGKKHRLYKDAIASHLDAPRGIVVTGGDWYVPAISVTHLSEVEMKAFAIADNRLGELAENDDEQLAKLLSSIAAEGDDALMRATGYDGDDIDDLLKDLAPDDAEQTGYLGDMTYHIVVDCLDEAQQKNLLKQFAQEGYTCRALIS